VSSYGLSANLHVSSDSVVAISLTPCRGTPARKRRGRWDPADHPDLGIL